MNHTIEITARSADIRPKPNSSSVIVTLHHPIADGAVDLRAMFPSEDEMMYAML